MIDTPIYITAHCKIISVEKDTFITKVEYDLYNQIYEVQYFCRGEIDKPDYIEICLN